MFVNAGRDGMFLKQRLGSVRCKEVEKGLDRAAGSLRRSYYAQPTPPAPSRRCSFGASRVPGRNCAQPDVTMSKLSVVREITFKGWVPPLYRETDM